MRSQYKVVLFTLGNVIHLNDECKKSLYSEHGRAELKQRSQDFYDCISRNFEVVAWGCGRHEQKELNLKNSKEFVPKIEQFFDELSEQNIQYDIIIQMGCHPNLVHKKPYFIYTDSGLSPALDLSELDKSFFPADWEGVNRKTDIFKEIFASATAVLTMSPLANYCLISANGVDSNKISCVGAETKGLMLSQEEKIHGQYNTILWIGGSYDVKNAELVVRAIDMLKIKFPNIMLTLMGISSVPDSWNIDTKHIKIIPFTSDQEYLDMIYRTADIFVLPSFREPFGLVYIEAMARKVPVIVSTRSGLASVVYEKKIGKLVCPDDLDMLVKLLSEWISKPEEADQVGIRGYHFVKENCTEFILSDRIREVIEARMKGEAINDNYFK